MFFDTLALLVLMKRMVTIRERSKSFIFRADGREVLLYLIVILKGIGCTRVY
jgi:hypothetical protein